MEFFKLGDFQWHFHFRTLILIRYIQVDFTSGLPDYVR